MSDYTLEEAEEILPEIGKIVKETRRLHRKIASLSKHDQEDIELEDEEGSICLRYTFVEGSPEIDTMIETVNAKLALLERAGIIIRNLDKGEIEFPSDFQGRRIVYHWKIGMKHIKHWYCEDDGYVKRKRIVDLTTKEDG